MLNTVVGKVFSHPVTKVEYGQIRIPQAPTTFSTLDGTSYDVVAEDGCGNYFTKTEDGAVLFGITKLMNCYTSQIRLRSLFSTAPILSQWNFTQSKLKRFGLIRSSRNHLA